MAQKKSKISALFSKVVQIHAADEFKDWVNDTQISWEDIQSLQEDTPDGDINQAMVSGPDIAVRAFLDKKADWLTNNTPLTDADLESLKERVFDPATDRFRESQRDREQERRERQKKMKSQSPDLSLKPQEKQALAEAFTSVLRQERQIVQHWVRTALNSAQQLTFWRMLANAEKQTAVDTIMDLAACESHDERTRKAQANGLLQAGNPLMLAELLASMGTAEASVLTGYINSLPTQALDQLNISLNMLPAEQREKVARLLAAQTDQNAFTSLAKSLGLLSREETNGANH